MPRSKTLAWFVAAVVMGAGIGWSVRGAHAGDDEETPEAPPAPLKALKHPYVDALVGAPWAVTQTTKEGTTKGGVTFRLGIGGTALLEDYEQTLKLPKVGETKFHGLAVVRIGDDGKALTVWWFDSFTPEVVQYHGAVTEKGFEAVAYVPTGTSKITMEKKGDGHEFKMFENGELVFTDAYARPAK